MKPLVTLRQDLRWETVEDDVLVLDPLDGVVHRLTGGTAEVARLLLERGPGEIPGHLGVAAQELVAVGLAVDGAAGAEPGLHRRRLIGAGAAAFAAAGIASIVLPEAAAAASVIPAGEGVGDSGTGSSTTTTTTAATSTTTTTVAVIAHPSNLSIDEDQVFSLTLVWS